MRKEIENLHSLKYYLDVRGAMSCNILKKKKKMSVAFKILCLNKIGNTLIFVVSRKQNSVFLL